MNMTTKNLLVELFVEELPPKALKKLGESFATVLADSLKAQGLATAGSTVTAFASPRRLAVQVSNVVVKATDKPTQQKLMPANVALDSEGKPTQSLTKKIISIGLDIGIHSIGWAAVETDVGGGSKLVDMGVRVFDNAARATDQAEKMDALLFKKFEGKADVLYIEKVVAGVRLHEGLQVAINEALTQLPIPKVMTYQLADGWDSVQFVRPAHGLIALHGADVVPVSVLGLQSGRTTQGHRFEAANATLEIRDADSYESQMENEGAVIPSFAKRRAEIARQLAETAAKVGAGAKPIEDDALLDEVTGLVERPHVLLCQFEAQFLEVPQECLILTMKANQKYFPLLDGNGKLTNKFLVVSNINPADASAVIGGNERVVRPRLADAKFFYDQDRKKTLEARVLGLAKVVYHNKLGTQGERVQRVCAIAKAIGQQLGGDSLALQAEQAALLAKADLLTDMVGEFPELQGIMGRYYAQHDGLSDDIAYAIEDHYKPRFAGDELPRNMVGICVALADKLETLVGMFGIGQVPTGDKDPFALRRHAIGVLRIMSALDTNFTLKEYIDLVFEATNPFYSFYDEFDWVNVNQNLILFILDRLAGLLRDEGYSAQEVEAVISLRQPHIMKRIVAVRAFTVLPEAAALAAANKRVGNILKKAEGDAALRQAQGERVEINVALLQEPAEQALHQALSKITPKADAAFERGDYTASLQALAALREPVDAFFDSVMVNAEDPALRANRLALLATLHQAMNRVADISKLAA